MYRFMKGMRFVPLAGFLLGLLMAGTLNASLRVSIPWDRDWPVVTPATAGDFGFLVKNEGPGAVDTEFSARFVSPSGVEEKVRQRVSLSSGEETRIPWSLQGREMGAWSVEYAVTGTADGEVKKKVLFGYLEPAGPNDTKPDFLLGVCAHSSRVSSEERQREIASAGFIGCKVMRNGVGWESIQPDSAEQWKWEVIDEIVTAAEKQHMQIEILLAYTTRWAAPPEKQKSADWLDWNRAAPDMQAWRTFVKAYAERFRGRIHLWEIWNEPDLEGFWRGTTEEYLSLFRAAREELKAVDPENVVMSGGFATLLNHPSRKKNPDLQERAMMTLGPQMDMHAVHEHGPFDRFAQVVDGVYADFRAKLPAPVPPIIFNETAEHSLYGTEKAQAEALVKKATFARARGAVGYFWYDLRNDGVDPTDPEHHFGLLTRAMEPKPAYIAFNTLARLMVPRPYLRQLDAGENRWFFLHGDNAEKLLVFWNEDDGSQNEQILLRMPGAARASLVDINGNSFPLSLAGDLAVVSSGRTPQYLLAEGAQTIEVVGRLAGPPRAFFGRPGAEVAVECEFFNPSQNPVTVKTDWAVPGTMSVRRSAAPELSIPAGSRALSTVVVKLPEGENYQFGRDGKLRVNYAFSGLPYSGRILIPVHYGTISVPADATGRAPDITLDRRDQLVSFIEADPHMVAHRWKDASDLSAQVWLRAETDDLVMKIAVTDDKHFQEGAAADMWRGDSVQCVLVLPEQKGSWELGFSEDNQGRPLVASWATPSGWQDCSDKIRVDVEKRGESRVYTVRMPRKELGLTDQIMRDGFRLNLAVNDNDGVVRAHALQLAPGLVANKSVNFAPYVTFEQIPVPK
ncbi:glycosyl hydrolases family 39 [Terrimicrobium sacchariphilum]|uniref:Glycosyl hydrolases family 39 n=1 Tax=Terrimicrobium sacchariphilum TaxID=690879 RepID=A0A146GD31_TERSA|nr:glycosyl hydrolases family 39 [Terrimicrobium sacchariphilum]